MAQHLDSRYVLLSDPSIFGAGGSNQNTSRIQHEEVKIPFNSWLGFKLLYAELNLIRGWGAGQLCRQCRLPLHELRFPRNGAFGVRSMRWLINQLAIFQRFLGTQFPPKFFKITQK